MHQFGPPNIEELVAKRDFQGLTDALGYKEDIKIRQTAALALGKIGDIRAVKSLLFTAAKDSNDEVRNTSLNALVAMGKPVIELLIPQLISQESNIRQTIINTLNQISPNWKDTELAQAALQTVAIRKVIRGSVFIEVVNPLKSYTVDGFASNTTSRVREALEKRGVPIAEEKGNGRSTIRLKWESSNVARYTSGAAAAVAKCEIQVIDNLTSDVVDSKEIQSKSPPQTTTYKGGEVYGSMSYEEVQPYIDGLSLMPVELLPFVLPVSKENIKFLETLDAEIGADPKYLNFRPAWHLTNPSTEASTRDQSYKPHAILNKVWIIPDTYQSVLEKVTTFLEKRNVKFISKKTGLFATFIADAGDAEKTRLKGARFADPEVLPKRIIIRLIPVVKGVQTNVTIGDGLGIGFLGHVGAGTVKRYEIYFQKWMDELLKFLSSATDATVNDPSNEQVENTDTPLNIVNTPQPPSPKSRRTALLLEILLGLIGLPGIGWLYGGRKASGIVLLAVFLVWDLIACVLVIVTSGVSACLTVPTTISVVIISAVLLDRYMKTDEQFGY